MALKRPLTVMLVMIAVLSGAVMGLGYLQAPVVVAGGQHWSGFRPDRIAEVSKAHPLSA